MLTACAGRLSRWWPGDGAGAGRRIDDRRRDYGDREVVQGKGTEFCLWGEPDDCPAGLGGSGQFADLGEVVPFIRKAGGSPSWRGHSDCGGRGFALPCCARQFIGTWKVRRTELRVGPGRCGRQARVQGIFKFDPSYWYVVRLCFTFYSAIFPFRTFAINFFTNKILAYQGGVSASEAVK